MIKALTPKGQEINIAGVWVAKYGQETTVLSADLGEQLHCLNEIKLEDGVVYISDKPTAVGIYDADEWDGLTLRSCDLKEGMCQIERISLDEDNYEKVLSALSK